jgi:hypothetical protein
MKPKGLICIVAPGVLCATAAVAHTDPIRQALSAVGLCDRTAGCAELIVQPATISNDGVEDAIVFQTGFPSCGVRNCPVMFMVSREGRYRLLDPELSVQPESVTFQFDQNRELNMFEVFIGDGSSTVWMLDWSGEAVFLYRHKGR